MKEFKVITEPKNAVKIENVNVVWADFFFTDPYSGFLHAFMDGSMAVFGKDLSDRLIDHKIYSTIGPFDKNGNALAEKKDKNGAINGVINLSGEFKPFGKPYDQIDIFGDVKAWGFKHMKSHIYGKYIYLLGKGENIIHILDVENPSNPPLYEMNSLTGAYEIENDLEYFEKTGKVFIKHESNLKESKGDLYEFVGLENKKSNIIADKYGITYKKEGMFEFSTRIDNVNNKYIDSRVLNTNTGYLFNVTNNHIGTQRDFDGGLSILGTAEKGEVIDVKGKTIFTFNSGSTKISDGYILTTEPTSLNIIDNTGKSILRLPYLNVYNNPLITADIHNGLIYIYRQDNKCTDVWNMNGLKLTDFFADNYMGFQGSRTGMIEKQFIFTKSGDIIIQKEGGDNKYQKVVLSDRFKSVKKLSNHIYDIDSKKYFTKKEIGQYTVFEDILEHSELIKETLDGKINIGGKKFNKKLIKGIF